MVAQSTPQLTSQISEVLGYLAQAVLPLSSLSGVKNAPIELIPPLPTLPWRNPAGTVDLSTVAQTVVESFKQRFIEVEKDERVPLRWLLLKEAPLTYFRPASGTTAQWRASRNLSTSAKFGASDATSNNLSFVFANGDGTTSLPEQLFTPLVGIFY
jgi:hypothetical protein